MRNFVIALMVILAAVILIGCPGVGEDPPVDPADVPATNSVEPEYAGTWYNVGGSIRRTIITSTNYTDYTWNSSSSEWEISKKGFFTDNGSNSVTLGAQYIYDSLGDEYDKTEAKSSTLDPNAYGDIDWDGVFAETTAMYVVTSYTLTLSIGSDSITLYNQDPTVSGSLEGAWRVFGVGPSNGFDEILTFASNNTFGGLLYTAGTSTRIGNFSCTTVPDDVSSVSGGDTITLTVTDSLNGPSVDDVQIFRLIYITSSKAVIDVSYDDGANYELTGVELFKQQDFNNMAGCGTAYYPYVVNYIEDLEDISNGPDFYYKLERNLDFNDVGSYLSGSVDSSMTIGEGFEPICSGANFSGSFNGDGHTISHLYINRTTVDDEVGLFEKLVGNGVIYNLGLLNANVTGLSDVGCIAGELADDSEIYTSFVFGNADGTDSVGLIAGRMGGDHTKIENCYAKGNVTGGLQLGTIAGRVRGDNSVIKNCYSLGNVGNVGSGDVGGISGLAYNNAITENCIAFNSTIISDTNAGNTYRVGLVYNSGTGSQAVNINCYANADMTVNGSTITSSDPTTSEGADMIALEFNNSNSYNGDGTLPSLNWDLSSIWEIKSGADRPTLRGIGNDLGTGL